MLKKCKILFFLALSSLPSFLFSAHFAPVRNDAESSYSMQCAGGYMIQGYCYGRSTYYPMALELLNSVWYATGGSQARLNYSSYNWGSHPSYSPFFNVPYKRSETDTNVTVTVSANYDQTYNPNSYPIGYRLKNISLYYAPVLYKITNTEITAYYQKLRSQQWSGLQNMEQASFFTIPSLPYRVWLPASDWGANLIQCGSSLGCNFQSFTRVLPSTSNSQTVWELVWHTDFASIPVSSSTHLYLRRGENGINYGRYLLNCDNWDYNNGTCGSFSPFTYQISFDFGNSTGYLYTSPAPFFGKFNWELTGINLREAIVSGAYIWGATLYPAPASIGMEIWLWTGEVPSLPGGGGTGLPSCASWLIRNGYECLPPVNFPSSYVVGGFWDDFNMGAICTKSCSDKPYMCSKLVNNHYAEGWYNLTMCDYLYSGTQFLTYFGFQNSYNYNILKNTFLSYGSFFDASEFYSFCSCIRPSSSVEEYCLRTVPFAQVAEGTGNTYPDGCPVRWQYLTLNGIDNWSWMDDWSGGRVYVPKDTSSLFGSLNINDPTLYIAGLMLFLISIRFYIRWRK